MSDDSTRLVNNQQTQYQLKCLIDDLSSQEEKEKILLRHPFVNKLLQIKDYFERKIFSLVMIIISCALLYYTDFIEILVHDERVYRYYLYTSIFGYLILLCFIFYLGIYPPIANLPEDQWEKYSEKFIPKLSLLIVISTILLILSVYDIYELYSIPIILLIQFGFVMTYQFAPSGVIGNVIFYLFIILFIYLSHIINHYKNS